MPDISLIQCRTITLVTRFQRWTLVVIVPKAAPPGFLETWPSSFVDLFGMCGIQSAAAIRRGGWVIGSASLPQIPQPLPLCDKQFVYHLLNLRERTDGRG